MTYLDLAPKPHREFYTDTVEYTRQWMAAADEVAAQERATTPREWTWLHGNNLG